MTPSVPLTSMGAQWAKMYVYKYSKKATKISEIFTVDLTVTTYLGQIYGGDFAKFVAFSEYMNFTVDFL